MTRLTGTTHPLADELHALERVARDDLASYLPLADDVIKAHHTKATSDVSVVALDGGGDWRFLGPVEDYGHLAGPEYVHIYSRDQTREDVAALIRGAYAPDAAGRASLLRRLVGAAIEAAPLVEVALAVAVDRGDLQWDTAETVSQAAHRLTLDAVQSSKQTILGPRDAFAAFGRHWGADLALDTAADEYLARRVEVEGSLTAAGAEWGGAMLDTAGAARRAGVVASTWRAYVARGEAPIADEGGRWRVATVDAWRMAAARKSRAW